MRICTPGSRRPGVLFNSSIFALTSSSAGMDCSPLRSRMIPCTSSGASSHWTVAGIRRAGCLLRLYRGPRNGKLTLAGVMIDNHPAIARRLARMERAAIDHVLDANRHVVRRGDDDAANFLNSAGFLRAQVSGGLRPASSSASPSASGLRPRRSVRSRALPGSRPHARCNRRRRWRCSWRPPAATDRA